MNGDTLDRGSPDRRVPAPASVAGRAASTLAGHGSNGALRPGDSQKLVDPPSTGAETSWLCWLLSVALAGDNDPPPVPQPERT